MRKKTLVATRMGKKATSSKAAESRKRKAAKKELQLPASKYGETDQTAPPTQTCTWKKSVMKKADIQALVDADLL